jgi:hypothetical protein
MVSAAEPPSQVQAEGVDKVVPAVPTPAPADNGAGEVVMGGKVKKEKRARVRFGEDEILEAPASSAAASTRPQGHDHSHDHDHANGHGHEHGHQQRSGLAPTPRATVRHDRPDLYEF